MKYEEPEMTVIMLGYLDVITGSDGMNSGGIGSDNSGQFGQN